MFALRAAFLRRRWGVQRRVLLVGHEDTVANFAPPFPPSPNRAGKIGVAQGKGEHNEGISAAGLRKVKKVLSEKAAFEPGDRLARSCTLHVLVRISAYVANRDAIPPGSKIGQATRATTATR